MLDALVEGMDTSPAEPPIMQYIRAREYAERDAREESDMAKRLRTALATSLKADAVLEELLDQAELVPATDNVMGALREIAASRSGKAKMAAETVASWTVSRAPQVVLSPQVVSGASSSSVLRLYPEEKEQEDTEIESSEGETEEEQEEYKPEDDLCW